VSDQVVGFFDVAARLPSDDWPIAALVGGSIAVGCMYITRLYV